MFFKIKLHVQIKKSRSRSETPTLDHPSEPPFPFSVYTTFKKPTGYLPILFGLKIERYGGGLFCYYLPILQMLEGRVASVEHQWPEA